MVLNLYALDSIDSRKSRVGGSLPEVLHLPGVLYFHKAQYLKKIRSNVRECLLV